MTALAAEPLCRSLPPDWWFPNENDTNARRRAVQVCNECPLRQSCLTEAIRDDLPGIWGGTTYRQRRRMTGAPVPKPDPHGLGMGPYREHIAMGELPCLDCCHYVISVERRKRRQSTGMAA